MEPTADELAGAVDLFGALTRDELRGGFEDLAARRGTDFDPAAIDAAIEAAVEDYYLLERDDLLVVGPAALPSLPPGGEDLPHLLDVPERSVDRSALAESVERRLRRDAARAVDEGDGSRARELLDVCYEVDAWGVDTEPIRERLADGIE